MRRSAILPRAFSLRIQDPPNWLILIIWGLTVVAVDARCRVGGSDTTRGRVAFVGDVAEIPGVGPWIGVILDEPVGKNDGSVGGKRYFDCNSNCGIFVRVDKVEIGDYRPLGIDQELDSDMEEL